MDLDAFPFPLISGLFAHSLTLLLLTYPGAHSREQFPGTLEAINTAPINKVFRSFFFFLQTYTITRYEEGARRADRKPMEQRELFHPTETRPNIREAATAAFLQLTRPKSRARGECQPRNASGAGGVPKRWRVCFQAARGRKKEGRGMRRPRPAPRHLFSTREAHTKLVAKAGFSVMLFFYRDETHAYFDLVTGFGAYYSLYS